jgi:hypothetical protein
MAGATGRRRACGTVLRQGETAGAGGELATAARGFRIVYDCVVTPEGDALLILRIFGAGQNF